MSERVTLWSPVSAVNAMWVSRERGLVRCRVGWCQVGSIAGAHVAPADALLVSALVVGQVSCQDGRRDVRGAPAFAEVLVAEGSILSGHFGEGERLGLLRRSRPPEGRLGLEANRCGSPDPGAS